jgi:hypothetical protein
MIGFEMRYIYVTLAAAVFLAGCVTQLGPAQTPDCGAQSLQGLIGQPQSALQSMGLAQPIRVMTPPARATMDFAPQRLNVLVDGRGIMTNLWCG